MILWQWLLQVSPSQLAFVQYLLQYLLTNSITISSKKMIPIALLKRMSSQTIISIVSINLGPFNAISASTLVCHVTPDSILQHPKLQYFPGKQRFGKSIVLNSLFKSKEIFVLKATSLQIYYMAKRYRACLSK